MNTVELSLANGGVTLIDECDFERVSKLKWYLCVDKKDGYRQVRTCKPSIRLARLILSAPAGLLVDHINHDTLDNRRANLRLCTNRQNQQNCRKPRGENPFKGVSPTKYGKYQARIRAGGKNLHLGMFSTATLAAQAYDRAAIKYFGEFAKCNFG